MNKLLALLLFCFISIVLGQGYDTQRIILDSSNGFSVEYFNNYKIVNNLLNNERYKLVCCGLSVDNQTGFNGVFNTPANNIAVDKALEALPFFELLNVTNQVQSAGPIDNVTSPCYANLTDSPKNTTNLITFTTQSTLPQHVGVSADHYSLSPLQVLKILLGQVMMEINGRMKLISVNHQTTVISNLTEFQNVLSSVDFVIDETPQGVFKDFSFAGWLAAANLSPSATFNFINNKNVYRTDGLVNVKGYSDYPIRSPARADLAISDIIHMVYNTYEPSYNMTWLRAFAQSARPVYVSNATYPSCTNPYERLLINPCSIAPFDPKNNNTITGPSDSKNSYVQHGLSTGGKTFCI
ncbi:hypothetical protein RO3G_15952 [Rhizopus delemar RA 99-880]|uniref:Uncharacterized protein n=1 Tax=Rhizopus delemar (strain RA 99-880 / ATCC MYA-4621 / FGSC 9543 / NRRL 43880) TaxID=246409 RepID=I1CS11_RHIO9|nr:hypothetical protein RO3G_15952 [Rhizopus delemar RA 99-880]|eukprot:EIE91241.1 hypothetical protein RO3G_15952 [Rhizopus delemar RA 99-880]